MALINWNQGMSVDVVEIDRQHQKLIEMVNELNSAMKMGKGKDTIGKILTGLTNYTLVHFKTEEKYFDRFEYPETDAHKKEHATFVGKVSDFIAKYESKQRLLTIEVMDFLSGWLKNHIMGTDKQYAGFFNENGLR